MLVDAGFMVGYVWYIELIEKGGVSPMRTILFLIAAAAMAYGAMTMGDAGSSAINAHVAKMEAAE